LPYLVVGIIANMAESKGGEPPLLAKQLMGMARKSSFWQLAVPLAFLLIVVFFFPSRTRFEFSTDEGMELMKAMLVEREYSLYSEIWSDQPPLFTVLLAGVIHFFGYKVGAARFLVVLLSCLLLWAAFHYMRSVWGSKTALAGALLIFLLPKYLILSAAVMAGLPGLSFAICSLLALTLWHLRRKPIWLALSAIALSLSVLIKLITGFLAVIFVLGVMVGEFVRYKGDLNWRKLLSPPALWIAVFAGFTLIGGLLLVGPANLPQLLETHLFAENVEGFRNNVALTINWHLKNVIPLLILALVGTLFSLQAKRWLVLYPLAWMVAAYGLLYFHSPVWDHHQLLVTIPAAILAASAVVEAAGLLLQIIRSNLHPNTNGLLRIAALISLAAIFFTFRFQEPLSLLTPLPAISASDLELGPDKEAFLRKMIKFAPQTEWVVTDLPMYAFRAGLPVPPELAVFSLKRVETGNLDEVEVLAIVIQYLPEQVLIGRFEFPALEKYLAENYRLIEIKDKVKLYVRNDL